MFAECFDDLCREQLLALAHIKHPFEHMMLGGGQRADEHVDDEALVLCRHAFAINELGHPRTETVQLFLVASNAVRQAAQARL